MFTRLLDDIKYEIISILSKVEVASEEDVAEMEAQRLAQVKQAMNFEHAEANSLLDEAAPESAEIAQPPSVQSPEPFVRESSKIGRNHPCPCGSGKKYKQCHGKLT
jgi:preprotein translocase subunit SecA